MSALSAQLGATSMPAPVEAQPTVAPAAPANVVDAEERQIAPEAVEAAARETVSPVPQHAGPPPSAARDTFESRLGARWAVWVGGIALAFGGIFLIRYSIESGLLGPEARLTLAVVFGLLLVAAGELIRRKALPQVSERYGNAMIPGALTAAGAVTLLAATYAAHGY
ncbi:MAG: DUF2339 domain-containing protein, partial [Rhizobiales bacterium]|nr:DUF2339 domain-containing protein [Hyphomicrobiales bacterium]